MPLGGEITISTSFAKVDQLALPIRSGLRPGAREGHFVCLSVAGTGEGLELESLRRLFDPDDPSGNRRGNKRACRFGITEILHTFSVPELDPV